MMIPQPPLFEPTPHERRRPGAQMKRITRRMRARLLRASRVLCDSASSLLYRAFLARPAIARATGTAVFGQIPPSVCSQT